MTPEIGRAEGGLHAEALFTEEIVFVVGPGHARARDAVQVGVGDLAHDTFVAFNEGAGLRNLLQGACRAAGFEPRIGYESDALSSIRAIASAGLGVAVLPAPVVRAPGPPLVELPADVQPARTISLVTAVDRRHSPAATALADLLRRRLAGP